MVDAEVTIRIRFQSQTKDDAAMIASSASAEAAAGIAIGLESHSIIAGSLRYETLSCTITPAPTAAQGEAAAAVVPPAAE